MIVIAALPKRVDHIDRLDDSFAVDAHEVGGFAATAGAGGPDVETESLAEDRLDVGTSLTEP